MHLRTTRKLAEKYLDKCIDVYGYSKHHDSTPYLEFQPYVHSVYTEDDNPIAEYISKDQVIKIEDVELSLPSEVIEARNYQYNLE